MLLGVRACDRPAIVFPASWEPHHFLFSLAAPERSEDEMQTITCNNLNLDANFDVRGTQNIVRISISRVRTSVVRGVVRLVDGCVALAVRCAALATAKPAYAMPVGVAAMPQASEHRSQPSVHGLAGRHWQAWRLGGFDSRLGRVGRG
ncbi:MAG: hypothetical protein KDA37_03030 [Planctomycetales bacterium]|nr:hypothetical protein [Planctomycetales bacterium]